MKKNISICLLAIYTMTVVACGQTTQAKFNGSYYIDENIKSKVARKTKTRDGITTASFDFKLYQNDSVIADTYSKGKGIDKGFTMTFQKGDTIIVTGFVGMFSGFGFNIMFYKDSCQVTHFAKSDAFIYKLKKTDSLDMSISVPCETYKLTLAKKPNFKNDESIEGLIDLASKEYFELANGKESKCKMKLTCYFKTDSIIRIDDLPKEISSSQQ